LPTSRIGNGNSELLIVISAETSAVTVGSSFNTFAVLSLRDMDSDVLRSLPSFGFNVRGDATPTVIRDNGKAARESSDPSYELA